MAEMIAERTLHAALAGCDRALEHELGRLGRPSLDASRVHELGGSATQPGREEKLVYAFGERGDRGQEKAGIGSDGDREWQRFAPSLGNVIVKASALLDLPMHAGLARTEHVHAIEAEVSLSTLGVRGQDETEGDEASAVLRPAAQDGQRAEIRLLDELARRSRGAPLDARAPEATEGESGEKRLGTRTPEPLEHGDQLGAHLLG